MFETTGYLNEAFFKETWWPMFGRYNKRSGLIFILVTLAYLGFILFMRLNYLIWVPFAMLGLYLLLILRHTARQRKANLARMTEVNGKPETRITTRFLEEGIEQVNHSNGGSAVLPYDTLRKLTRTEHYCLLHTKSDQVAVVFRDASLDEQGLLAFLKTTPTSIKWKS